METKAKNDEISVVTTISSNQSNTTSSPITISTILEQLKDNKEWVKAVVYDHEGTILAATVKPMDGEVNSWLKLFDKREDTIASGILLLNEQYDVHRFHPPLLYGRRGDPAAEESEGICVCRVERKTTKQYLYCLITYTYPTLSARAAPQLKEFCETIVSNLV